MIRRITLKEIANELNVSISTVSKSLKDSHEIGVETREKIKAFAKAHNYRPNNIALSLKNRKTKTIGVIIPEIVHHFFSIVINSIEKFSTENGYNVIIAVSNESFEKEVLNMETLANGHIDGIIMSIAKETLKEDMAVIGGIPPWVLMYFEQLKKLSGEKTIKDIFPNFNLFVYGGVNFSPYRDSFKKLIGKKIDSIEYYPASEGFFAYQDTQKDEALLLQLNSGIFYEFVELEEMKKKPKNII